MQFLYQTRKSSLVESGGRYARAMAVVLGLAAMTTFVIAQDRPASSSPADASGPIADTPILIVHNVCPDRALAQHENKPCEWLITRSEFSSLIAALDPKMPESNRLALATEYVRLLTLAREAQRLKLDQTSEFKVLEDFTRLQLLERQLVRKLSADSSVSDAEVAEVFKRNQKDYEQGVVRRIVLPKSSPASASADLQQAQEIRKRVIAGEDMDQLQREIWTMKRPAPPAPSTRLGPLQRSALPAAAQGVFDLKAGEVASVIDDQDEYCVYKLESKTLPSLETVAPGIRGALASEHLQDRVRQLRDAVSISVNEDYFGALPKTEDLARRHGLHHHSSSMIPMTENEKKPSSFSDKQR